MAAAVSAVWQPTIIVLMHRYTPGNSDLEAALVSSWKNMANGICTIQPRILSYFPEESLDPKGCYSIRCLCFGSRPVHKMRVCKGCWNVRYCSKRCQKEYGFSSHRHLSLLMFQEGTGRTIELHARLATRREKINSTDIGVQVSEGY